MGCKCGSGSNTTSAAQGSAYVWEWTDLNGKKHQFDTDQEAYQEREKHGGSVTPVLRTQ